VRDRCEHVVASITDDGGWEYSPFEHAPLPLVPRELRRIEPTTEDWQEVFGEKDSEVIADAYTDYRSLVEQLEWEHERRLFLLLIERQRLECESSSWEVGHWFTSSHGTDYFSLERERIRTAVNEGIVWLTAGLERLFSILRARHPEVIARWAGARHLFDVPEDHYRPKRAERRICRWYVDNPVASTSCRLSLLGAPAARTFGLYFEVHHLGNPESLLFAELPRTVANDPLQLFEVLQTLFARNGAEDHGHYLLKCPPHGIWNGAVLDDNALKMLFTTCREITDYVFDAEKWWDDVFVVDDSSATA